jgi:AraC-like DNA-binding protein
MANEINPINEHNFDFHQLLHCLLIVSGDYEVASVAEKMHISSDTLYRYVEDKLSFPIERLVDLTNATDDLRFLDYFASKCGYNLVPKIRDRQTAKSLRLLSNILLAASREGKS